MQRLQLLPHLPPPHPLTCPRPNLYLTPTPPPPPGTGPDLEDFMGPHTHTRQPWQGKVRTALSAPFPKPLHEPQESINLLNISDYMLFFLMDTLNDAFYLDCSLKPLSHPWPFSSISTEPEVVPPSLPLESTHLDQLS